MAVNMKTMLITDSRGRGLQPYLDSVIPPSSPSVRVITHPGAGLELAVLKSLRAVRDYKPQIIIIAAGVCDLTWKNRANKMINLRHRDVDGNVDHVMSSMKAAYDLIRAEGTHKVTFATLTGVDLADSNNPARRHMNNAQYVEYNMQHKTTHSAQITLNRAILKINKKIGAFNRANNVNTVWLAGLVHAYIKGTYHHYYRRLYDGCHLDDKTKAAWARQIVKSISRITMQI